MFKKRVNESVELKHRLYTRVNTTKFKELQALLAANPNIDMSALLRDILYNRPIRVFTHDRTIDVVMQELSQLRGELRSIGVNINQITRHFNTYPEPRKKAFYAAMAFKEYQALQPLIEQIFDITSKIGKKWLSG